MASENSKYPYPTDVRVGDYVLVKLTDFNYTIWKPMMVDLIRSNGLMGFIDGTVSPPPPSNPEYKDWKQKDALVRRWILQSLSNDMLARVASYTSAKAIWSALDFGLSNPFPNDAQITNVVGALPNLSQYLPLYHAVLKCDWATAEEIFKKEPGAVKAIITGALETPLMIAVRTSLRNRLVKILLDNMFPADLVVQNCFGDTALHIAAGAGNIEAAQWLVKKNSLLPNVWDKSNMSLPLHRASGCGKREMVVYLLTVTNADLEPKPFEGESGLRLVHSLIAGGLYDISLSLLKRLPCLASAEYSPLQSIALKQSSFPSGTRLNSWQRFIYSYIPISLEDLPCHHINKDLESAARTSFSVRRSETGMQHFGNSLVHLVRSIGKTVCKMILLHISLIRWAFSVPLINHIREKKLIHHQAIELVKYLCMEIVKLDFEKARLILGNPLRLAATIGTHEVVEEILATFPSAIYLTTPMLQNVFHLAIVNRHENVFNLIYQFQELWHLPLSTADASKNFALHLVGYMKSEHLVGSPESQQKLYLRSSAPGAALQMQRELQWFKVVKELSLPQDKEQRNTTGKTAAMIFAETHEELAKEGEQWMKDRANSGTIVAALVATVVFAAAITVPGGNKSDDGLPVLASKQVFVIFAVADALALFASTASMLMFLGILTSRYALEDFLYSLPKRLIIGLITLFLSILFMMVAFSSILYLVFGDGKAWVASFVSIAASIPVFLFVSLQFRPLVDIVKSTYGRGIFGKQSDRILF